MPTLIRGQPDQVEQAVLQVVEELVVAHAAAPALAVHARGGRRPGALTARRRLQVVQHALVAVVDLVTELAQPQAQVDVLEVVVEAGVEPTRLLECVTPDEHARRSDRLEAARLVDRRMVRGAARVQVQRVALEAEHDSGVLHGAVGKQELAADDGRAGAVGIPGKGVEPPRLGDRVVVEEDQAVALGRLRAGVAGGRKPGVALQSHVPDRVAVPGQHLRRLVRGRVIHDEDLVIHLGRVLVYGIEALAGQRRLVVHRDDYRATGARHGLLLPKT